MQDMREIEFRDSESNANTKICFEVQATTLRAFTQKDFHYIHTGPPTKGIFTEKFAITNFEHTTLLSNTTTSTQKVRHKAKTTIISTQEGLRHKAKLH